jgi:hypothetical protein
MVEEFFTSSATLKLTLWKDNQKVEAKVFGSSLIDRCQTFCSLALQRLAHQFFRVFFSLRVSLASNP